MRDSGGLDGDVANKILDHEIEQQVDDGAFIMPSVLVNGVFYRGNLLCDVGNHLPESVLIEHCGLLGAICAGFPPGTKPTACINAADKTSSATTHVQGSAQRGEMKNAATVATISAHKDSSSVPSAKSDAQRSGRADSGPLGSRRPCGPPSSVLAKCWARGAIEDESFRHG